MWELCFSGQRLKVCVGSAEPFLPQHQQPGGSAAAETAAGRGQHPRKRKKRGHQPWLAQSLPDAPCTAWGPVLWVFLHEMYVNVGQIDQYGAVWNWSMTSTGWKGDGDTDAQAALAS